jgi:hypothetical protein
LPATFGYAVPEGGSAWQEVQLRQVRGEPDAWQTVQVGPLSVAPPASLWHVAQPAPKVAEETPVCSAVRYGTEWLAAPGPPGWHEAPPKESLKQLGAAGSGPVPAASVLWQMAHAVPWLPESRWEDE